jgi:hypothetical protein
VTAPLRIEHVTIDSGQARRSPRSEVDDEIVHTLPQA